MNPPTPCGALGDGQLLFRTPEGDVIVQAKVQVKHLYRMGVGPLRFGSLNGPWREDDFCACVRGQVALQWFKEGLKAMPALLEAAPDCGACQPTTGLVFWRGWYTDEGSVMLPHLGVPDEHA